jgi:hypothetical protein
MSQNLDPPQGFFYLEEESKVEIKRETQIRLKTNLELNLERGREKIRFGKDR